ncbi:MAG TPA: GNAT family N-acetyltransferase [Candidatus Dormibacteraeota bacterium]|nr:GNAT family N-acetyltransferase [Candidatus Dormibacteraeota bacterium]
MPAVSQGLADWANGFRQPAQPGWEIVERAHYRLIMQPDFPVPGPNSAAFIRCRTEEADGVISEVTGLFDGRALPFMWVLDPGTEPPDFADFLTARGFVPDPHGVESAVMVLPTPSRFEADAVPGLELRNGLADLATFRDVDSVNAEAFAGRVVSYDVAHLAQLERRLRHQKEVPGRHVLLATVDGEAAGSAGLTVYSPDGAILNGGAVRPKFRGRGVYRAMVAARIEIARQAGVPGLSVWGGPMSAPILQRLGFQKVGWRRFYMRP